MTSIDVDKVATHSFDWGVIKWLVSPDQNPGAKITFGEVVLLPGQGHVRHNHSDVGGNPLRSVRRRRADGR